MMQPGGTVLLYVLLELARSVGSQARSGLPDEVRSALDRMHPGWRVADVSADVRREIGTRLGPTPNVIAGEFDGNGDRDIAVLIDYRNVDEPDKAFTHYSEAIAFLKSDSGYHAVPLRDRQPGPNSELFLTLQKHGDQGFVFEANRKFVYRHDAIGEWFFEKGDGSYIYENGKFRYVIEAD